MNVGVSLMGMLLVGFIIFAIFIFPLAIGAWMLVKLVGGGSKERETSEEESRLIQEIYHGLGRMESRVETLETLLLDREKREARHDV